MIRIGIVGAGARAAAHVAALQRLATEHPAGVPPVRLTAFVDPLVERAERAAGTDGMAAIEGTVLRLRRRGETQDTTVELPPESREANKVSTYEIDREFLLAIAERRPPAIPGEAGRDTLALCDAVHRSSAAGHEVTLAP